MASRGHAFVKIHDDALAAVAEKIQKQAQVEWDEEDWHYQPPRDLPFSSSSTRIRNERIALYILALDMINFCFWPAGDKSYEYVDLACTLTSMASADHETIKQKSDSTKEDARSSTLSSAMSSYLLSPSRLREMSADEMTRLFETNHKQGKSPPDMEKRCRLWNELGLVLCRDFEGSAVNLIESAQGSAVQLVQVLFDQFEGFRDVATLVDEEGGSPTETVYFLKRAQICVGDLQAALDDKTNPALSFKDMNQITTFADYRLPQLLRHWHVLEYVDDDLRVAVDNERELVQGSAAEISIRSATVVTVERLVEQLSLANAKQWTDVQVDWYLWQVGEKMEGAGELKPHHRVRTVYY